MTESSDRSWTRPLLLVAVGGFVGAALRYTVSTNAPSFLALDGAVVGTLLVNVAGSFALGVVLYDRRLANTLSAETRVLVGTGLLSSFTTYSTFAVQTSGLGPALAVGNVAANYALGFLAIVGGRLVARWYA